MAQIIVLDKSLHIFGEEKILTVSELSSAIKGTVEKNFVGVRLQGEVSGIKKHTSGHIYLSLKDNDSLINAVCWKWTKIGFSLEDGLEIIVRGRVAVYTERSLYQFVIEEAVIAGEGALLKLLNERKKLFSSLGYFDKKNKLPKFPKIIGIVTSETGSVLQDMRHRLEERYPFCYVVIWPVNVQGNTSAEQVSNAVRGFNYMSEKRPDIIIVARGGGSVEDLWPFNEEIVVKAVFESKIPVISAIGHETDTTLIDYAADLRAPTPTAAIELATPVLADIKFHLSENYVRLEGSTIRILREFSSRISSAAKCLSSSQFAILGISQKFDDKTERFQMAIENFIEKERLKLTMKKIASLENYMLIKNQQFTSLNTLFIKNLKTYTTKYAEKLSNLFNRLEQSSFKKILEKGFCFVTDKSGKIVDSNIDFIQSKLDGLKIHFQDGVSEI